MTTSVAPSRPGGRVRLTRRGRVVVLLALLLLLSLVFSVGHATMAAGQDDRQDRVLVVQQGETLWDIAQRVKPGQDPRPLVHTILEANAGVRSGLRAGQQLRIPAG